MHIFLTIKIRGLFGDTKEQIQKGNHDGFIASTTGKHRDLGGGALLTYRARGRVRCGLVYTMGRAGARGEGCE